MVKYIPLILLFLIPTFVHADTRQFSGAENGTIATANLTSGTVSISTTVVRHGRNSFRTNPSTTALGYLEFRKTAADGSRNADFGSGNATTTFWFRAGSLPITGKEVIHTTSNVGNSTIYALYINPDGTLTLRGQAVTTWLATSTTALLTNGWYCISIGASSNAAGFYELKINNVTEFTGTGNFGGASTYRQTRLGKSADTNSNSVDFYYDTMVFSSGSGSENYCNDETRALLPDSNGTYTGWTTGTGASDWTQVDEYIPDSNTTYVASNSNSSEKVSFNASSTANVGITGTIKAIKGQVGVVEQISTAGTVFQTLMISGAVESTTTSQTGLSNSYAFMEMFFATSTETGSAWTTTELDAIQIGGVSVTASTTSFRITQASVEVLFTSTATATTFGHTSPCDTTFENVTPSGTSDTSILRMSAYLAPVSATISKLTAKIESVGTGDSFTAKAAIYERGAITHTRLAVKEVTGIPGTGGWIDFTFDVPVMVTTTKAYLIGVTIDPNTLSGGGLVYFDVGSERNVGETYEELGPSDTTYADSFITPYTSSPTPGQDNECVYATYTATSGSTATTPSFLFEDGTFLVNGSFLLVN